MRPGCRALAALALAALAGEHGIAAPATPAAARLRSEAEQAQWRQRIGAARAAVEETRRQSAAAALEVQRMRHSKHPRGAAREALLAEREASDRARAEAERELNALLEEARRAGVPPGWLRDDSEAPAAPAPPE